MGGEGDGGAREVVTVLMTAPGAEAAEAVVRPLIEAGLAACGNILPGAASIYRWEGKVHRDPEAVVILKTVRARVAELLERARALHPYDVPELLVQPVEGGSEAYLEWVRASCGRGTEGRERGMDEPERERYE